MKKNITIHLFGQLYHIDEDAYELLHNYETNVTSYFAKQEDGEEVADDIKHRIAELLSELCAQGKAAITIEDVQLIIERIGDPESITEAEEAQCDATTSDSSNPTTPPPFTPQPTPLLGRNIQNKMIGGVISGFTTYFGGKDPLPWRFLFIAFLLISYFCLFFIPTIIPIIVYLILWAILPPLSSVPQTADNPTDENHAPHQNNQQHTEAQQDNTPHTLPKPTHRLYRNLQDLTIGGVISGITTYFGFKDPLPWRILFVILTIFMWGVPFFAYLILWAIIPPAITAEQQLELQGKPVNHKAIREQVIQEAKQYKPTFTNGYSNRNNFLSSIKKLIIFIVIGVILLIFTPLLVFSLIGFISLTLLSFNSFSFVGDFFPAAAAAHYGLPASNYFPILFILSISAIICIILIIYFCFNTLHKQTTNSTSRSKFNRPLFFIWCISLLTVIISGIAAIAIRRNLSYDHIRQYQDLQDQHHISQIAARTAPLNLWHYYYIHNSNAEFDQLFHHSDKQFTTTNITPTASKASAHLIQHQQLSKGKHLIYLAYKTNSPSYQFLATSPTDTLLHFSLYATSLPQSVSAITLQDYPPFSRCTPKQLIHLQKQGWKSVKVLLDASHPLSLKYGFVADSLIKQKDISSTFLYPYIQTPSTSTPTDSIPSDTTSTNT